MVGVYLNLPAISVQEIIRKITNTIGFVTDTANRQEVKEEH